MVGLIEREEELRRIDAVLSAAAAGIGAVLTLAGPPGIGKTSLLQVAQRLAEERGMNVLRGCATEIEADVPFGVVRQLLAPALAAAAPSELESMLTGVVASTASALGLVGTPRADGDPLPADATLTGLFWLVAALAERAPSVICVDDAQWCDMPSWRFLFHLAQRCDDVAVAVLIATRASDDGTRAPGPAGLDPVSDPLVVAPLSAAASAELVRHELTGDAEPEFCDACHAATGGNPFLLRELIAELRREGIRTTAAEADRVASLVPANVVRTVTTRLRRLGANARAAAQAMAILGPGAQVRWVGALAELSERTTVSALDALVEASIVRMEAGLEFVHPLVRGAVYQGIPPARRGLLHTQAGRLLARDDASVDVVASQLLRATPAGEPAVVEALRAGAELADRRGAPEVAVRYLERALAEPPARELRAPISVALARARVRSGNPGAVEELARARDATQSLRERAAVALELGRGMVMVDRAAEALEVFRAAREELGGANQDLASLLEAEETGAGLLDISTAPRALSLLSQVAGELSGDTLGQRLLLAYQSHVLASRAAPADEVAEVAKRALAAGDLVAEQTMAAFCFAVATLAYADRHADAMRALGSATERAGRTGSRLIYVLASWMRANVQYRQGALASAEADAWGALAVEEWFTAPIAFLTDVLIERGALKLADEQFARHGLSGDELFPNLLVANLLLDSRGRLRCAQGRWREGLADLLAVGQRLDAWGTVNPAIVAWRSNAALAYAALGDLDSARRLSDEEVAVARAFGAPRALGVALRVAGLLGAPGRGLELLAESVSVLERSGAQLEHARALVDYGAALRRRGRRTEARELLRAGLDRASLAGATVLAAQAREELVAAGARPRRERITGADALTASERRVAALAAEGMSNREIAQALFVTIKTVKAHLGHVFAKLDVSSRSELAAALVRSEQPSSRA